MPSRQYEVSAAKRRNIDKVEGVKLPQAIWIIPTEIIDDDRHSQSCLSNDNGDCHEGSFVDETAKKSVVCMFCGLAAGNTR